MKLSVLISYSLGLGLLLGQPALSQNTQTAAAEPELLPIEKRLEQDMITMPDMVQALAKNLGQLHYLRTLCFGQSDQTWREFASRMMDIEAPTDADQRRRLTKAFNNGFYEEQSRYGTCSENVSTDAAALAENGRHLSTMLGDPYRE